MQAPRRVSGRECPECTATEACVQSNQTPDTGVKLLCHELARLFCQSGDCLEALLNLLDLRDQFLVGCAPNLQIPHSEPR